MRRRRFIQQNLLFFLQFVNRQKRILPKLFSWRGNRAQLTSQNSLWYSFLMLISYEGKLFRFRFVFSQNRESDLSNILDMCKVGYFSDDIIFIPVLFFIIKLLFPCEFVSLWTNFTTPKKWIRFIVIEGLELGRDFAACNFPTEFPESIFS